MITLPPIGLGTAGLGLSAVREDEALSVVCAAIDAGIGLIDTAPLYGGGLAERRVGHALRLRDASPLVSTKVGYSIGFEEGSRQPPSDRVQNFSADGVRASLDGSLARLGLDAVGVVFLHDPPADPAIVRPAFDALTELKRRGVVGAIGIGCNDCVRACSLIEAFAFDAVMIAGRLSLLDQSARGSLLPMAGSRDIPVIAAGVFSSGILAAADPKSATIDYEPATDHDLARLQRLEWLAARHGCRLKAAALQFASRHDVVSTTILGPRNRIELADCLDLIARPLPVAFWRDLDAEGEVLAS